MLGPLEVTDGSDRLLGGRKQRAVLARLLLTPNSVVTLGALADASWGEDPPEQARSILQVYVANLRRLLDAAGDPEGSRIVRRAGGYELRVGTDELDLHRFERLVTQGRVALARRDFARASALLREGLTLWRGVAFPDLLDGA